MLIDERGNFIAANVSLVSLSLILALAALISMRQGRFNGQKSTDAAVQLGLLGRAMGIASAGFGVASAVLFALSQNLTDSLLNSSAVWTPVLVTIAVIQIACTAGLLTSIRLTKKRAEQARFKIRY